MSQNSFNYTRGVVIVHGKSEYALVKYIYTNLHLPMRIVSKNKGRGSIQINGLLEFLNQRNFRSLKTFANEYVVEYDKKSKKQV